MLDIYFIEKDNDPFEIPENPDEGKWIGSIDLFDKNIEALQSSERNTMDTYEKFMKTISDAIELQAGIVSFCD